MRLLLPPIRLFITCYQLIITANFQSKTTCSYKHLHVWQSEGAHFGVLALLCSCLWLHELLCRSVPLAESWQLSVFALRWTSLCSQDSSVKHFGWFCNEKTWYCRASSYYHTRVLERIDSDLQPPHKEWDLKRTYIPCEVMGKSKLTKRKKKPKKSQTQNSSEGS